MAKPALDVIGPSDFMGQPEEINEGSDSFAISTAMIEPLTEPTTTTALPKERTVEPLVLTTTVEKNATVHNPSASTGHDESPPLPDEAMAADPFSVEEEPFVIATDQPVVAPVVPAVTSEATSTASPPSFAPSTMTTMETATAEFSPTAPVIQPTLEGRALKEKEEEVIVTSSMPTSSGPLATESESLDVPSTSEKHDEEDHKATEGTTVSDAMESATTAAEIPPSTPSKEEAPPTTSSLGTSAKMMTESAASPTTASSAFDEDAPFDQEKLSGLFEQDGSFIPEHFINQPSSEPVFPRVELPEESEEILNGRKNTNAGSTITTGITEVHETTPTTSTADSTTITVPQPSVVFLPIDVEATTKPKMSHDSEEAHHSSEISDATTGDMETLSASSPSAPKAEPEPAPEPVPEPKPEPTAEPAPEPAAEPTAEPAAEHIPDLSVEHPTTTVLATPEPKPEPEPEPQPEPRPEPTSHAEPEPEHRPEPEPKSEPEPEPHPHAEPEPHPEPEPKAEPEPVAETTTVSDHDHHHEPEPEPEPKAEPEPEPNHEQSPHARPPQPEPEPAAEPTNDDLKKAAFTMRITSIEYEDDFGDKSSGKYKKLRDQLMPQVNSILKTILGDNFAGFEITSLTKGSVVVNGLIITREDIQDAEDLATKIETTVSTNKSAFGQLEIDSKSITVNGIPSRAYIDRVQSSYPQSASPSALLIGSIIAVGVVVILIVAFIIIAINNRRTNGTMKLKGDDLPRVEAGKGAYTNPQAISVNLMSYGNGSSSTPSSQGQMMTSLSVNSNEREVC
ncbi:hypothetical protein Q1695_009043 [Nippostrongylus brasiliensis]|nr:hypothetical protein Q1695_009043 [Nippostrongylus brasiliensis]